MMTQKNCDDEKLNKLSRTVPITATALAGSGIVMSGLSQAQDLQSLTTANAALSISDADASRFLAQASMGANRAEITKVQKLGFSGWIDAQMAMPVSGSRWDWLIAKGFNAASYKNSEAGFDSVAWRKLFTAPDTLRQRITLLLSEIIVVSIDSLIGGGWRAFSAAAFLDLLEANCFGNYKTLLQVVSTSPNMGQYLTYRGNTKYNPVTGSLPDENYAREIMQLFSIGLVQLNTNGKPKLVNGKPVETYTLADISGLARIFTGWDFDLDAAKTNTPNFLRRPMKQVPSRHETGASNFLGGTVPAGLSGEDSLKKALDILFAHPNVAPFICRQLIQKLVTSNPSNGYVERITALFQNDGKGVKGNLKVVIKAILLDDEARNSKNILRNDFGRQREPMLRFIAWGRAYSANSASDVWGIGNTSDPGTRLGQSPLRSPTVFNFFRPGYVPPNSPIAKASLVAPEFQLTNESSVVGYINYMQKAVSKGVADVVPDYTSLLTLADNAVNLVNEINLVLAAGQIRDANLKIIRDAINSMPYGTDAKRKNRVYAALTLVLASPDFIVFK